MKMNQTRQDYKKKPWLLGMNNREWRLWLTKQELDRLASLLKIKNSAKQRAAHLLKKAYYSGLTQRRRRDLVVLSTIYYASLEAGNCLEFKELCTEAGVGRRKLNKTYTGLRKGLELKLVFMTPEQLLQKYGSRLGATQTEIEAARKILRTGAFKGLSPRVGAATSLYLAMGLSGVPEKFAKTCNTSSISIRNALKRYGAKGRKSLRLCCLAPSQYFLPKGGAK